jgi:[NiFe] hydrogenase assembly HybE family chaperone
MMKPTASPTARVDALVALFTSIAQTRMSGVPILNASLRVEAVGVEPCGAADADGEPGAAGILITPWFMNLVWFPLERTDRPARSGTTRSRVFERGSFDFICAHEPVFGDYEACSLFSPMFDFADQDTARETANSVLQELRRPAGSEKKAPELPARRSFLLGRSAGAAA